MFANWVQRFVKQSIRASGRRTRRAVGRMVLMESRTLLSASIGASPKINNPFPSQSGARGAQNVPLFPLADTFKLHSRPNASKVIYLDFNGQSVTGTAWNSNGNTLVFNAYSDEGDASFTNNELETVQRIWARVVEDFAPFDVDVTTEEPPLADLMNTGGGDTRWGVRTIISSNDPLNSGAGGIAYIGSFSWDSDTPALVFNGGEKAAAETVSHEVGTLWVWSMMAEPRHPRSITVDMGPARPAGARSWARASLRNSLNGAEGNIHQRAIRKMTC